MVKTDSSVESFPEARLSRHRHDMPIRTVAALLARAADAGDEPDAGAAGKALSRDGQWELYDLAKHRAELHDLSAAQPDRIKSMSDAGQRCAESLRVLPLYPGRVARAKR
jgi:hypothetical protein